ncbi:MAG: metallophosphoesterase [Bacilli bacterium]|nr:metallophosphoesterase [Bacilli bacterium]
MKKLLTFFSILISIFLISSIPSNGMYAGIANITAAPGETMDKIGINYHTRYADSYVIYGTDSSLKKFTKVTPEVHEWEREVKGDYPAFEKRYVCSVNLSGLKLYTTYYYQVIAGSEKSDICKFNTGLNESVTTFAWITDSQTYDNGYDKVEAVFQNLLKANPNIAFMLNTGDVTDRAGKEAQWNGYFSQFKSVQSFPNATIPGNHEYYTTAASGYDSPEIYNQYFNNPKNSFEGRMNSSYYFYYNNILFLMVDAIKNEYVNEQRAWITEVLENNTADFIIVGIHAGLITGGNYSSDAKRMKQAFGDIFEEYAVDIILSGHEHAFCVQKTRLDGEINPDLGVTHVIGPAVGNKTYKANDDGMDYVQNLNYGGCIITVTSSRLTLKMYNNMGDEQYSLEIKNRRGVSSKYNEESFLKSLKVERDAEKETATLVWNSDIYGYVDKITVTGKEVNLYNESNLKEVSRKIKLANIYSLDLGANYSDTNYYYDIVITKLDGTTITKTVEIINNEELLINKYTVTFKDKDGNILKEETVKEGEDATAPTAPSVEGYNFVGWDKEFDDVEEDLVITALYEEIKVEAPAKEGCKKELLTLTTSLIACISLAFIILRKKN